MLIRNETKNKLLAIFIFLIIVYSIIFLTMLYYNGVKNFSNL